MTQPLILLDVDNLAHRNTHAFGHQRVFDNPVTFGMLRDLGNLAQEIGSTRFVFCFDSDTSLRREEFPAYKNRPRSEIHKQIRREMATFLTIVMPLLGYKNAQCLIGGEADDVIAAICKQQLHEQVVIVSNDSDLWQLLDGDRVTIWNPARKCFFTEADLYDDKGLTSDEWRRVKILSGCRVDGIPGIKGIGPDVAARLVKRGVSPKSVYFKRVKDSPEIIARNSQLITLPYYKLEIPFYVIQRDETTARKWQDVCQTLGMDTLISKYPRVYDGQPDFTDTPETSP